MGANHQMLADVLRIILILALMVFILSRKSSGIKEYDERQYLARSKAYRAAFWMLAGYFFLYAFLNDVCEIRWADLTTATFIGFFLALSVFAIICIITDSFFSFRDKPGQRFIFLPVLFAANLLLFALNLADGTSILTDGLLNFHSLNLVAAIAIIPIYITLVFRYYHEKRQTEKE